MLTIIPAAEEHLPLIIKSIRALAEYEKLAHEVRASEEDLKASLFGKNKSAECILAYYDNVPAGFAIFFHNFSTFLAKPGLYLEDLFVFPEMRDKGIGKQLLLQLMRLAKERGCGRMEWSVLDWNKPAIDFYERLGAKPMKGWTVYRLTEEQLQKF